MASLGFANHIRMFLDRYHEGGLNSVVSTIICMVI